MKILEKKHVEINFSESLLRMAADDVKGVFESMCACVSVSFKFAMCPLGGAVVLQMTAI